MLTKDTFFSYQFGFMGIVEEEWIATLSTIDPDDITFLDLVEESRALAQELRDQVQNEFIDFQWYLMLNHYQTTPQKKHLILVVILCYILSIVLHEFWMNASKYISRYYRAHITCEILKEKNTTFSITTQTDFS